MSTLWFFWDLAWVSRKKPGAFVPELVFDDVQVFYHNPSLGSAFSILFFLRFGLLKWLCLGLDHLNYIVTTGIDKFVLLMISTAAGEGSFNIHRGTRHSLSCRSQARCCNLSRIERTVSHSSPQPRFPVMVGESPSGNVRWESSQQVSSLPPYCQVHRVESMTRMMCCRGYWYDLSFLVNQRVDEYHEGGSQSTWRQLR